MKLLESGEIKNYNYKEWHEEIKKVLIIAGVENKDIGFFFSDNKVISDRQWEDINSILKNGDIVGLYSEKELEGIMINCKIEC